MTELPYGYLLIRDPRLWSRAENKAWHQAIPDVRKAFLDLAKATPQPGHAVADWRES